MKTFYSLMTLASMASPTMAFSSLGQSRSFASRTALLSQKLPIMGGEEIMSQKAHGTSEKPVQKNLRWSCDYDTADRICNFNRHYAEHAGYWEGTKFLSEIGEMELPIKFYDSVTGVLLFTAPLPVS